VSWSDKSEISTCNIFRYKLLANFILFNTLCYKVSFSVSLTRYVLLFTRDVSLITRGIFGNSSFFIGAVHKRRMLSGRRGFVHCGQGLFFRFGRLNFLVQKTSDFFLKTIVCPHGQGERGSIFSEFCADVFYGPPLVSVFQLLQIYKLPTE